MHARFIKAVSFFLLLSVFAVRAFSQRTELRANLYSGLFSFRGDGATTYTSVHYDDVFGYFNPMPYGKKSAFSYAFELQAQRVTRQRHLYGVGVSFERLASKAIVDSSYSDFGRRPATGEVELISSFVTVNPYIGQRFALSKILLDVTAGADIAFSVDVTEKVSTSSNKSARYNHTNHRLDIRPRLQVGLSFHRIGLLAGYSLGTRNYYHYDNPYFIHKKTYSSFLRAGISYKLKDLR